MNDRMKDCENELRKWANSLQYSPIPYANAWWAAWELQGKKLKSLQTKAQRILAEVDRLKALPIAGRDLEEFPALLEAIEELRTMDNKGK